MEGNPFWKIHALFCWGLWFVHAVSIEVRLFTMVRVTDTLLLEHFLKHYHSLGVQLDRHARFVLQEGDAPPSASSKIQRILGRYNIANYVFVQNYTSHLKTQLINEYIITMHRDNFVLYPDIDEFFDFPCDLQERIARGIYTFWGRMADRLGPGFTIPTLKASPDIHEQFPISCPDMRVNLTTAPKIHNVRRHRPLNTRKHVLFKAKVNTLRTQFLDSHNLGFFYHHKGQLNLTFVRYVSQTEVNDLGFFAHFVYAGSDVLQKWKNKQAQASAIVAAQQRYMNEYIHIGKSGIELTEKGLGLAAEMCVET
eukprot:3476083-Amphidinium_carterae.1